MEFKFNTARNYFTEAEKKHLDEFAALELQGCMIYKNAKGEEREVGKVDYPEEIIIKGQTHYGRELESGGFTYCTPIATIVGGKLGYVNYKDEDGWHSVDSKKFMIWLGTDYQYYPTDKKPQPAYVKARLEMKKAQSTAEVTSEEEMAEKVKDWNPTGKKNVSTKTKK